jgi:hypothetical protein
MSRSLFDVIILLFFLVITNIVTFHDSYIKQNQLDQAINFDFVVILVMMLVTKRLWFSINEHVFTNILEIFFHG